MGVRGITSPIRVLTERCKELKTPHALAPTYQVKGLTNPGNKAYIYSTVHQTSTQHHSYCLLDARFHLCPKHCK